ncbi:MAG: lipopolysaccharide core heptose(I) kinase RfaP [Pseudohongiellaceae bacterium]
MLYLSEEFKDGWKGADPYLMLQAMQGTVYRQARGRKTMQFALNNKSYFVKLHTGVGWGEILKNLTQGRLPILGAGNEWLALQRLRELGVDSMHPVAFGSRGLNPANRQSFIITEALKGTVSLEDFCAAWPSQRPDFALKKALINRVADVARTLHHNGICHRDFYICHFLLHRNSLQSSLDKDYSNIKLSLIDLHRALIKKRLTRRWVIKDVSGLYFSTMDIGLTRTDRLRFISRYESKPPRQALTARASFWARVQARAAALYQQQQKCDT